MMTVEAGVTMVGALWVRLGCLGLLASLPVLAAAPSATARWPAPVLAAPDAGSPRVATVSAGAPLAITACEPACDAPGGWAGLESGGVIALAAVRWHDGGAPPFVPEAFVWGLARDADAGVEVYQRPSLDAPVDAHEPGDKTLAFLAGDDALLRKGWLARPGGGFVPTAQLRLLREQSALRGEPAPTLPLAFVVRPFAPRPEGGTDAGGGVLPRYARLAVLGVAGDGGVRVDGGVLPPDAVRVAWPRERPPEVPEGAQWLLVDTSEQTLVAFEGERPVFATLVSTGVPGTVRATVPGLYRVTEKALHDRMHGDEYFIEQVPFLQYFNRGQALHAAWWHDRFGAPVSHGCVNLSTADAAWLFQWGRPALPPGFHTLWPLRAGLDPVWVLVEGRARPRR